MDRVTLRYTPCHNDTIIKFLTPYSPEHVPLGHAFQVTSNLDVAMILCDHFRQWLAVLVSIKDQPSRRGGEDNLNELLSALFCSGNNQGV